MSKVKHEEHETPNVAVLTPEAPPVHKGPILPMPLLALFGIVLIIGILVGVTRNSRLASNMYDAMDNCDASVLQETNGLDDRYGVVKFNNKQAEIAAMLGVCDTNPPLAREVFRKALDERHKSAQLIALYSSYFLAGSKQLDKDDWTRMVNALDASKEKNADVRKAAQRAIGDLVFITDKDNLTKYQAIPAAAKESSDGTNRIQTREEKMRDTDKVGYNIRWSNADLAFTWLQEWGPKGQWDNNLQRFVLGK